MIQKRLRRHIADRLALVYLVLDAIAHIVKPLWRRVQREAKSIKDLEAGGLDDPSRLRVDP